MGRDPGSLGSSAPRAQLIVNHLNPLIRGSRTSPTRACRTTAIEALYGQALLLSRRPLRPADHALLNRSFIGLLEFAAAASTASAGGGGGSPASDAASDTRGEA